MDVPHLARGMAVQGGGGDQGAEATRGGGGHGAEAEAGAETGAGGDTEVVAVRATPLTAKEDPLAGPKQDQGLVSDPSRWEGLPCRH